MVLAGDVAVLGAGELHGLVVAAVAVFQLEGVAARRQAHELAAQADAENRLVLLQGFLQVLDGGFAHFGVAGAVRIA